MVNVAKLENFRQDDRMTGFYPVDLLGREPGS